MVVLISGASHTGKTALAQKLLEKYKYPYLSIDHLKMGLIRSGNTALTPEDDEKLEEYLWPIVREIVKTAIENNQNLIVEGCYIPFDWRKDFESSYLGHIRFYVIVMTENYINGNFEKIKQFASVIEKRLDDSSCTKESVLADNQKYLNKCLKYGYNSLTVDQSYDIDVDLDVVAESERLLFRKITDNDFAELCEMLKDAEVMYAWEHAFNDDEVNAWIKKRMALYDIYGYDYFIAVDKRTSKVVGQIGLLDEVVGEKHYIGLGYILKKEFWHKGYAYEGAKAMLDFAFDELCAQEVVATIRPENYASRKVAERIGMVNVGSYIKMYNGKEMPHLIYSKRKADNP